MNKLNYTFFEEFKRLEKICKDIYNSNTGVTDYINDMKSVPKNECLHIKNFESDLNSLIRFRHIRNHLAHSEGGFDEEICTQKDIETIREFYYRILTSNDPMALAYKNKKQPEKLSKNNSYKAPNHIRESSKDFDFQKNCLYWIIMIIIIILLFIVPKILII